MTKANYGKSKHIINNYYYRTDSLTGNWYIYRLNLGIIKSGRGINSLLDYIKYLKWSEAKIQANK